MEVFNKFYSSVSNTVSQLSGVLPGNPVTREFEATQFIASAGPGIKGLIWSIICIQTWILTIVHPICADCAIFDCRLQWYAWQGVVYIRFYLFLCTSNLLTKCQ